MVAGRQVGPADVGSKVGNMFVVSRELCSLFREKTAPLMKRVTVLGNNALMVSQNSDCGKRDRSTAVFANEIKPAKDRVFAKFAVFLKGQWQRRKLFTNTSKKNIKKT